MSESSPIYQPTELRRFLTELGTTPRKALSQNFLIDGNILRKIAATADIEPGDVVLEIGPGPGSLTQVLLAAGARVVAVEKDLLLARALERLKEEGKEDHLYIYQEDILRFPILEKVKPLLKMGQKAKVIANLPYHLTTPIIAHLVEMHFLFSDLTVMVQEEVGRRFTGKPGDKDYSSFTVFLDFYSKPHYGFTVSHNCFYPKPKVDSAVVVLKLREPPQVKERIQFFLMVRTAFGHRRKMLKSSLKELYSSEAVGQALIKMGKDPLIRPEQMALEDFLILFDYLN